MAITYSTNAKDARLQAVADLIESGEIELWESGVAKLASWTVSAVLTASGGVLSITNAETNNAVNAIAAGTANQIRIRNLADTEYVVDNVTVTISGGGGEVQFDSVDVSLNQEITLGAITLTHV